MRARIWTLIVLILLTAGYVRFLSEVHAVPLKQPLAAVPLVVGEWQSARSEKMDGEILKIVGVEDYLWRQYRNQHRSGVSVYVGYYEQQREGDQIHSPKHCLPGGGWRPVSSDVVVFDTPGFNGGVTRANRYLIARGDKRQLVLYWYQSRGRDITNEYLAKVWLVWDSIFRKRNDGSLVRLISAVGKNESVDDTERRLIAFGTVFLPELGKILPD
jgi:EpsI family protein